MKELSLSQGKTTVVDDDVFDYVNQWKWSYSGGYAVGHFSRKRVLLHRVIAEYKGLKVDGLVVDHIDRNKLNNQLFNLRPCSNGQNARNQRGHSDSTSTFKGVHFLQKRRQWVVNIGIDGSVKFFGMFHSQVIAAVFANDVIREHHGEFAVLNEIPFHVELLARQVPPKAKRRRTTEEIIAQLEHAERVERAYSEWLIMKRITDWQAQHTASPANEAADSTGEAA